MYYDVIKHTCTILMDCQVYTLVLYLHKKRIQGVLYLELCNDTYQ